MDRRLKPISEMSDEEILIHYGVKGMRWGSVKGPTRPVSSSPSRPSRKELDYDFILPGGQRPADPKVAAVNAIQRIDEIVKEVEEPASDKKEPKKAAAATTDTAALNAKIKKAQQEVDNLAEQRDAEQAELRSQMARESFKAEILRQVSKYFVTGPGGSKDSEQARRLQESSSKRIKEYEKRAKLIEVESEKRKASWDSSISEAQGKVDKLEGKVSHEDSPPAAQGKLKPVSEMSRAETIRQFNGYQWSARRAFRLGE